jgi:hypothetical protein
MSTKVDGCRDAVDRLTTGSGNEPGPLQARFALNGLRQIVQFQLASLDVTNKSGFPACFPLAPGAMIAAEMRRGMPLLSYREGTHQHRWSIFQVGREAFSIAVARTLETLGWPSFAGESDEN